MSSLVSDASGNLVGTTANGGNDCGMGTGCGVLFSIAADGSETVLHTFCADQNCTDGATPLAGLTLDSAGIFFGTTSTGGSRGAGSVFKFGTAYQVLHSFQETCCRDGGEPYAPLIVDGAGHLFGTARYGGTGGGGVAFELKR